MKIGILCAGDDELAPFLPCMEDAVVSEKAMLTFYEGRIGAVPVVALYSGVCKVNAAVAAQLLIDAYAVDAIINAGTAGGMHPELELFDTVIATETAYHDMTDDILTEFHPWLSSIWFPADETLLRVARSLIPEEARLFFGRIVTGEAFIEDDRRDEINRIYAPLSVDMETAAVAHVCYVNRVPFLSIRCITDTATHIGHEHFEQNCRKASERARDVVLHLLKKLS